jgi:NifU-like protein involved in Fe-S cluster formation
MAESAPAPYGNIITEHFRRPRNQGALPNASASAEGVNPLCGDRVRLAVLVDPSGVIAEARFVANACAICVATASLLTERVRRVSREDATNFSDEDLLSLAGGAVPAGRRRCATLPLETLHRALAAV